MVQLEVTNRSNHYKSIELMIGQFEMSAGLSCDLKRHRPKDSFSELRGKE